MKATIGILAGDGIGPEVMREGIRVLHAVARAGAHEFELSEALIGGAAIDETGQPFPSETREIVATADAALLGAVGGPKWSDPSAAVRPEQGLLDLRAAMNVYANIRPVRTHPTLFDASPLRPEFLDGVDIIVVRELTGGIYFGDKKSSEDEATDTCTYRRDEVERVVRMASEFAASRRGKLTSVDKANVLETSRLWRRVTDELVEREYPQLELETLLVDAAAMHLLSRPRDFDVVVTENMFGDILTDEASMLCGSLGMLPSASLSSDRRGLFEPIHGSAPDIAGMNRANPCGMILSVALMLRYSLGLSEDADRVEASVFEALEAGHRTADLADGGTTTTTTQEMGAAICKAYERRSSD